MHTFVGRVLTGITAIAAVFLMMLSSAPSASAFPAGDPVIEFNYNIDATTTVKKLNQTITVKGGTFIGGIDLNNGQLRGTIKLPPASFTYKIAGLVPVVTATAQIVPTYPVVGKVDFNTFDLTATSRFNIRIVKATAPGVPLNLVGNSCVTETPVVVTMTGNFVSSTSFSGTYTLPNFKTCGASTTALNLLLPGPGNTFSATVS
jgi:hypothetical protein